MTARITSISLRNLLLFDAATGVAMAILLIAGAGLLATFTGLPAGLLFYAGVALLPIAAFMAFVAIQASDSLPAVGLIVVGNALWVAASIWLMGSALVSPNALGYAFIAAQALVVSVLTVLQYRAVRHKPAVAFAA